MSDGYDRFENEGGGGSFVIGLLTGTVLGAGLGMLFAPRAGTDLRHQISEQAGNLAHTAQEGYRRASETAGSWAEKGREMSRGAYDKTREAVSKGADEAERYVREATGASGTGSMTGASFPGGDGGRRSSESIAPGAPETTLGSEGGGRSGASRSRS
jgi:gas vesicle protein